MFFCTGFFSNLLLRIFFTVVRLAKPGSLSRDRLETVVITKIWGLYPNSRWGHNPITPTAKPVLLFPKGLVRMQGQTISQSSQGSVLSQLHDGLLKHVVLTPFLWRLEMPLGATLRTFWSTVSQIDFLDLRLGITALLNVVLSCQGSSRQNQIDHDWSLIEFQLFKTALSQNVERLQLRTIITIASGYGYGLWVKIGTQKWKVDIKFIQKTYFLRRREKHIDPFPCLRWSARQQTADGIGVTGITRWKSNSPPVNSAGNQTTEDVYKYIYN